MRISDWSSDVCSADLLALTGADATADAHAALMGARVVRYLVQIHNECPEFKDVRRPADQPACSTRTKCFTLSIIPRTAGVSSSSRTRWSLFSPRPIRDRKSTRLNSSH